MTALHRLQLESCHCSHSHSPRKQRSRGWLAPKTLFQCDQWMSWNYHGTFHEGRWGTANDACLHSPHTMKQKRCSALLHFPSKENRGSDFAVRVRVILAHDLKVRQIGATSAGAVRTSRLYKGIPQPTFLSFRFSSTPNNRSIVQNRNVCKLILR